MSTFMKKLPIEQAEGELREYFSECAGLQRLNPSGSPFYRLIHYYLKLAEKDGYPPWRLLTIARNDPQLYELVTKASTLSCAARASTEAPLSGCLAPNKVNIFDRTRL